MLQETIRRTGYRTGMLERFEELKEAAAQIRRILIRCNLRLVVSIAKRHIGPLAALSDLTSEGNLCLIRAVECYDFSREARFATYATWALTKHFARVVPEENYRMSAFVTGQQARLDAAGDAREILVRAHGIGRAHPGGPRPGHRPPHRARAGDRRVALRHAGRAGEDAGGDRAAHRPDARARPPDRGARPRETPRRHRPGGDRRRHLKARPLRAPPPSFRLFLLVPAFPNKAPV